MFATLGKIVTVPFAWAMRLFYSLTGSYGMALILFTLLVKLVTLPFQLKSKKSMLRMSRMQSKVNEIKKKYQDNKQKQDEETAKLYQEEGVNPMSGCLWSLLPFPILLALYAIIRQPLSNFMMLQAETVTEILGKITASGYTFTSNSAYQEVEATKYIFNHWDSFSSYAGEGLFQLNYNFLGLDLAEIPSNVISSISTGSWAVIGLLLIPILTGVTQVVASLLSMKQTGGNEGSGKAMLYIMPLFTAYIAFSMPAALGVYWVAQTVFSAIQDTVLNKVMGRKLDQEEAEREEKKAAAKKFRQEEAKRIAAEQKNAPKEVKKKESKTESGAEKLSTTENGRVGDRPYARGRSFKEEHYN